MPVVLVKIAYSGQNSVRTPLFCSNSARIRKKFSALRAVFIFGKNRREPGPPGGGGYSHTLPIRIYAAQRGRDFEAPDLERGIHFRGVF